MKLTNNTIYQIANNSNNLFDDKTYIPVKANFYIQKNLALIAAAAQEIERSRLEVAKHYGELDEEKQQYIIPEDKIQEVSKEMEELFSIEQDLDIKTFSIEALGNLELTTTQMQILMFMIAED